MMPKRLFEGLFDMNDDGELDASEQVLEFAIFDELLDDEEKEDDDFDSFDEDSDS